MNLPYPAPTFMDGPGSTVRPVSLPVFTSPLPNTTAPYLMKQRFQQFRNVWVPLGLNTKHPNYPTYVLVQEGAHAEIGGGLIEWERTYAQIPSSYSEFETYVYQFIGIDTITGVNVAVSSGRVRFNRRVTSRVQYDFYLVSSTATPGADTYGTVGFDGNASGAGPGTLGFPFDAPGSIPSLLQFLYVGQAWDSVASVWVGGIYYATESLGAFTLPSTTQYAKMMDDALQQGWNSTVSVQRFTVISAGNTIINPTADMTHTTPTPNSVFGGQILSESTTLSRWMGNIWMRKSRYILAQ